MGEDVPGSLAAAVAASGGWGRVIQSSCRASDFALNDPGEIIKSQTTMRCAPTTIEKARIRVWRRVTTVMQLQFILVLNMNRYAPLCCSVNLSSAESSTGNPAATLKLRQSQKNVDGLTAAMELSELEFRLP